MAFTFVPVGPAPDYGNTNKAISIQGFDEFIKDFNEMCLHVTNGSREGLLKAAMIVRRKMDEESPKIPVDLGNLRGSWQVHQLTLGKKGQEGYETGIMMGFSANYALWVHEMVGANFSSPKKRSKPGGGIRWTTPREGAGAKFFETALRRNRDLILQEIASYITREVKKRGPRKPKTL